MSPKPPQAPSEEATSALFRGLTALRLEVDGSIVDSLWALATAALSAERQRLTAALLDPSEENGLLELFAKVIVEGDGAFTGAAWEDALCEAERIHRAAAMKITGRE